jgi:hypothetical protein
MSTGGRYTYISRETETQEKIDIPAYLQCQKTELDFRKLGRGLGAKSLCKYSYPNFPFLGVFIDM